MPFSGVVCQSMLTPESETLRARTNEVDGRVIACAQEFLLSTGAPPVALVAAGGYGRCELFPYSDVDLLILTDSDKSLKDMGNSLATVLRNLWDDGLRISHSSRTITECTHLNQRNTELHISLLDVRFLCGERFLFDRLETGLERFYERNRLSLSRNLADLTRQRHAKYNDTIYHLEPNVKETPGGIRDIHFLHWLNQLSPGHELLSQSIVDTEGARQFLYGVRIFLHERAKRDNNLLRFDLQDEAASILGGGMEPAEWMRLFFQNARQAWQASTRALELTDFLDQSLLKSFRDVSTRLSTDLYSVIQNRIFLKKPEVVTRSSQSVLELFVFSATHGIKLSWEAQRILSAETERLTLCFADDPCWEQWSELLRRPYSSVALQEMQESGVLAAALPEWKYIDSLVVRDFYHRYTVDEHTLVAISVVDSLERKVEGTSTRFQKLLGEIEDPALLRLALLLHDIGKGTNPGEHVEGSIEIARKQMARFEIPAREQQLVLLLIEQHLTLSSVVNTRDLEDPATARMLATAVNTPEALRYLALLTYADISAVNPTTMTTWRTEQLWRAYTVGDVQLARELDTERIHSIDDLPEESRTPGVSSFLRGLPTRYLRMHSQEEIVRHSELWREAQQAGAAVEINFAKGVYQATVIAKDKAGLFASICGALAGSGMNIVKAEAFINAAGYVVDQFRFTDPMRVLELNPGELEVLWQTLINAVVSGIDMRAFLRRRRPLSQPARVAQIAPSVRFNNEASDFATLVEFVGEDRPGLLYELSSAIAGMDCNIEVVLIDTEAHRAIDVFYITHHGEKLEADFEDQLEVDLIRAAEGIPR